MFTLQNTDSGAPIRPCKCPNHPHLTTNRSRLVLSAYASNVLDGNKHRRQRSSQCLDDRGPTEQNSTWRRIVDAPGRGSLWGRNSKLQQIAALEPTLLVRSLSGYRTPSSARSVAELAISQIRQRQQRLPAQLQPRQWARPWPTPIYGEPLSSSD